MLELKKEDISFMSALEMKERINRQDISSEEITEIIIERIEKVNPIINAYCTTTFNLARKMAKDADNRVKNNEQIRIINGIPNSIKDLNMVKGVRTTFGSKIYENNIPEEDDIAVNRLRNAGGVFLGKTNTPEFGFKAVTDNLIFGASKNPWDLGKTTGGSSGGAASVIASGLGPLALGSDAGGSIRLPACLCGVYGLKPSFGRVPFYPKSGIAASTLAVIGPIVKYVDDAALMLDVMKGSFEGDRYSLPSDNIKYVEYVEEKPKKLKIGYTLDLGYAKFVDEQIKKAVINSSHKFEEYDWMVEEIKMKVRNPEHAFLTIITSTFAQEFKPFLKIWEDKMDPDLVKIIKAALTYDGGALPRAIAVRKKFCDKIYKIFKDYDVIITPSTATTAFELGLMYPPVLNGKKVSPTAWQPFSFPFNLTGHPVASIPCGWDSDGLPIGMQIVGKRFDELTILQVSKAFEEISPWQDKRPEF